MHYDLQISIMYSVRFSLDHYCQSSKKKRSLKVTTKETQQQKKSISTHTSVMVLRDHFSMYLSVRQIAFLFAGFVSSGIHKAWSKASCVLVSLSLHCTVINQTDQPKIDGLKCMHTQTDTAIRSEMYTQSFTGKCKQVLLFHTVGFPPLCDFSGLLFIIT